MAHISISLQSAALGYTVNTTVCMPEGFRGWTPGKKYKVLWLIPGAGGDGSDWARLTCIEQYASEYGFYVISPETQLGCITDVAYGYEDRWFTFTTQELPAMMRWMFPLSDKPEDNYLLGFSMGGYGAFKWAMTCPEQFAALGTFGGVHDMVDTVTRNHLHDGKLDLDFFLAFNTVEDLRESPNDAMWLAKNNAAEGRFGPRLFFSVGDDDFTRPFNIRARDALEKMGYQITWDEAPGTHNYFYCESRLRTFLEWAGFTAGRRP